MTLGGWAIRKEDREISEPLGLYFVCVSVDDERNAFMADRTFVCLSS